MIPKVSTSGPFSFALLLLFLAAIDSFMPLCVAKTQVLEIGRRRRAEVSVGNTVAVSTTPSAINFVLQPRASSQGSGSIFVTTSWGGASLLSSLAVYAGFSNPNAALSGADASIGIPSSAIFGLVPTGLSVSWAPFTQTCLLFGSASCLQIFGAQNLGTATGSRNDNLNLRIDLTTLPQLPAGTYTGTLLIEAQAF